jgi:predicted HD phosphohydrolase
MRTKSLIWLASAALALGAALVASGNAVAMRGDDVAKDRYVDMVVELLRKHVVAMRWILDHDIKYSDNMVRHAHAFERAFGMIGPMEYHAAEAAALAKGLPESERFTEQQFEDLAEESMRQIHALERAAARYLRDKDEQRMRESIDAVIDSCGACHLRLPKGTTPPVWQGLRE